MPTLQGGDCHIKIITTKDMGLSIRVDTTSRLSSCQSENMNTACGDYAASSDKITKRSLYTPLYTWERNHTLKKPLKLSQNEVSISQRSSNVASCQKWHRT